MASLSDEEVFGSQDSPTQAKPLSDDDVWGKIASPTLSDEDIWGSHPITSDPSPKEEENIPYDESFLANVGRLESKDLDSSLEEMSHPIQDIKQATSSNFVPDTSSGPAWLQRVGKAASAPLGAMGAAFSFPTSILGAGIEQAIAQGQEPEDRAEMSQQELQKESNVAQAGGSAITGILASGLPLTNKAIHDNVFPPEKTIPIEPLVNEGPIIEGENVADQKSLPSSEVADNISTEQHTPFQPVPKTDLTVRPSDTNDSFNIVDESGDHVLGGFDSRQSAEDYIDEANTPAIGNEPEEWSNEVAPYEPPVVHEEISPQSPFPILPQPFATDRTDQGTQTVIPGAEQATQAVMAQKGVDAPLAIKAAQKPANLFDTSDFNQGDIFNQNTPPPLTHPSVKYNLKPSTAKDMDIGTDKPGRYVYKVSSQNGARDNGFIDIDSIKNGNARIGDVVIRGMDEPSGRIPVSSMRDIANQLLDNHPDITQFSGERVSGARNDGKHGFQGSGVEMAQTLNSLIAKRQPTSVITPASKFPTAASQAAKYPVQNFLKQNGGVEVGSNLAAELSHMGINNRTAPGLFKAKGRGGLKDIDNFPASEWHLSSAPNDGTYVDRQYILDSIASERSGKPITGAIEKPDDIGQIEDYADNLGIDIAKLKGETNKNYINRLKKAIADFHKDEEGAMQSGAYRMAIGRAITLAEKAVGKIPGDPFKKMGEAYIKTMAPELVSSRALRADAYMAKNKAKLSEARNALYKISAQTERAWDRASNADRENFLEAQDTGNYINNDPNNPMHLRYKALTDATHAAEAKALGRDPDKNYRSNYFPRIWEKPDEVKAYLNSPAMIKKFGPGWFNKARQFDLYREAKQAGFKLVSNNPETLLQARLMAGQDMIAKMNLLKDLESDQLATPARAFSIDKRIAKIESALADARKKYKDANNKVNDPRQLRWDFADPAVNKYMTNLKARGDKLNTKLAELQKEKSQYNHPPTITTRLKGNGFKIIGPDDKVWHLDNDMLPLWKNAVDSQGLWERQGLTGNAYRGWQALRNTWVPIKLGLSLFHPLHVATIHVADGLAEAARNIALGGKASDSAKAIADSLKMGFGLKGLKGGEAVKAWNKPAADRTADEQQVIDTMNEGGFVPKMSERDIAYSTRAFQNALHGNLLQKTVVMPVMGAQGLVRKISSPIFEHWIPALKTEAYLTKCRNAINRDPSLATDAGKRGEVFRQIAKDTDRTYGEMNYDNLFWNKTARDAFNASFLSGGWKLAQLYYARGLSAPFKMASKYAKTGKLDPKDITHNMMFSYIYGAMGLALGAAFTKMMGGNVNSLHDMVFPQTGEKDKDGKPIRVSLPFFNKEFFSLGKDVTTQGLMSGSASFVYDQTLYKGIIDTLKNQDYVGRPLISNPSDVNQWAHQAWDTVKPITLSSYQQSEARGSEFGKKSSLLGIGLAPAYANQTPFEQKVLYEYDRANPPKGDSYTASLKSDYRAANASGDDQKADDLRNKMSDEGMTGAQINALNKTYSQPFIQHAWKELSVQQQHQLIDSASDDEKTKFRLKVGK